ncbi:TrmH family RNA methyltransferase [Roseomonas sp. BN140053]|uniref:TrmH family RNA methyltransferase n=1 Tax=Roseomonas sp. BN140053 TaxID=3391898 RepID=UPI0039E873A9
MPPPRRPSGPSRTRPPAGKGGPPRPPSQGRNRPASRQSRTAEPDDNHPEPFEERPPKAIGRGAAPLPAEHRDSGRHGARQPAPGPAPRRGDSPAAPHRGGSPAAPRRHEDPPQGSFARRGDDSGGYAPRPALPAERPEPGTLWLHGLHAVAAALVNPRRRLKRLLLTADAQAALVERCPPPWKLPVERVEERSRFHTFLPEDAVHQGAALLCHALAPMPLEEALAASSGPVVLLDQVTDPRNVGAILRSAAAFGAAAVVMQDRHAPPETGALARAASGALEVVPVVREVNLSRVIQLLQRQGAWVMGLAGDATRSLAEAAPRDRRAAIVLGAEDAGLRRLQRETCDELVRLPISPAMESLNVSAAAAVALYELARDRPATD